MSLIITSDCISCITTIFCYIQKNIPIFINIMLACVIINTIFSLYVTNIENSHSLFKS